MGTGGRSVSACHLNALVEQIDAKRFAFSGYVEEEKVDKIYSVTSQLIVRAVCFHVGDGVSVREIQIIRQLCRLPYSVCWFEIDVPLPEGVGRYGLIAEEFDGELYFIVFQQMPKEREWILISTAQLTKKFEWIHSEAGEREVLCVLSHVLCFLSALNCSNVHRIEHRPSEKIQKARAKRGKKPLFSFWTLHLNFEGNSKSRSAGGTHASPRLHLRRGHARQYAPGKWTWVRDCAVGSANLGVVNKEYSCGGQR